MWLITVMSLSSTQLLERRHLAIKNCIFSYSTRKFHIYPPFEGILSKFYLFPQIHTFFFALKLSLIYSCISETPPIFRFADLIVVSHGNFLFRCCTGTNACINVSEVLASLSLSVSDLEPYRVLNDLPQTGEEELTLSTSEIKI